MLSTPDLLDLLNVRGGQELSSTAYRTTGNHVARQGTYCLTARGEALRVTSPTGQTHDLSQERFADLFRRHTWSEPCPTGIYTDLGPLFDADAPNPL